METLFLIWYDIVMKKKLYEISLTVFYWLSTLKIASYAPLRSENLSYIANTLNHRIAFILWCIFTIVMMSFGVKDYIDRSFHKKFYSKAVVLAALLFLMNSIFPYFPHQYQLLSTLHLLCGFFGPLLLYISMLSILLEQYINSLELNLWLCLGLITFGIILKYGSINSLAEIVLSLGIVTFLQWKHMTKV